jgi:predicted permease
MDTLWQDIRLGVRSLARAPLFTAAVVITLGLGIGANAAVFTIVNRLLLKPLPVRDAGGLYVLAIAHEGNEQPHNVSWLDYQDYRAKSGAFEDLAAYSVNFVGLSADSRAERIAVSYVTSNYFSMLGVPPAFGRVLQPGEAQQPGADPVIVLGHSYWAKRFNGDPAIVGRAVLINGRPFTVAGVVPPWFQGVYALVEFDAYLPLSMQPADTYRDMTTKRDEHSLHVIGRLTRGLGRERAQAAVGVLAAQIETQYPETNKTVRARLIPERLARPEAGSADQTPVVAGIFLVLVGLVLLVACVNVVNLIMVRATTRQREMAVRAALGAARRRIVRQMLTESLILAVLGGAAGALVGRGAASLVGAIQLPGDLPFRFDLTFDWRVFGYIAGIALAAGVGVGLLPALRSSRADLNTMLREGGRGASDGAGRQRARSALVVAQVAVSLVLLVAAALFVRSVSNAQSIDLGFDPSHVLNASMDVEQQGYDEARGRAFFDELLRRAKALPGVQSASLAYSVPLGYYNAAAFLEIEGQAPSTAAMRPFADYNAVTPGYIDTIRPRLSRGRFVLPEDDERGRKIAVINEFMAQRFWPGQDPIGKALPLDRSEGRVARGRRRREEQQGAGDLQRPVGAVLRADRAAVPIAARAAASDGRRSCRPRAARRARDPRARPRPAGLRRRHDGADDPGAERLLPAPHGGAVRRRAGPARPRARPRRRLRRRLLRREPADAGDRRAHGARRRPRRDPAARARPRPGPRRRRRGGRRRPRAGRCAAARQLPLRRVAGGSDHVRRRADAARRDGARRVLRPGVPRDADRSGRGSSGGVSCPPAVGARQKGANGAGATGAERAVQVCRSAAGTVRTISPSTFRTSPHLQHLQHRQRGESVYSPGCAHSA